MATSPSLHTLLLLSDSALPLGSFAFSSGLESFLAHSKHLPTPGWPQSPSSSQQYTPVSPLLQFLQHSIANQASTTLSFLLAAHSDPSCAITLDDILDASTSCAVARRSSTAQGRALLGLWERALRHAAADSTCAAARMLDQLCTQIKTSHPNRQTKPPANGTGANGVVAVAGADLPPYAAHLAPLFGLVALALGINASEACYVFLLNHAKSVLSAAVRAGAMGPYQSQGVLSSMQIRDWVAREVEEGTRRWEKARIEERQQLESGLGEDHDLDLGVSWAGVSVPAMDLWMGRHELLYSRIFNS